MKEWVRWSVLALKDLRRLRRHSKKLNSIKVFLVSQILKIPRDNLCTPMDIENAPKYDSGMNKTLVLVVVAAVLLFLGYSYFSEVKGAHAETTANPATVATTSVSTV